MKRGLMTAENMRESDSPYVIGRRRGCAVECSFMILSEDGGNDKMDGAIVLD